MLLSWLPISMDKSRLKERRRKLSDHEDNNIDNNYVEEMTLSTTGSNIADISKMSGTSRRASSTTKRLRHFERSSTPMLEMIEQQSDKPLIANDVDLLLNKNEKILLSQDSMETISDDDDDELDDGCGTKPGLVLEALDSSSDESDSCTDGHKSHHQSTNKTDRRHRRHPRLKELDVEKYMAGREMTPFQERMNAVTVMPGAFYCIMFLLSGSWLRESYVDDHGYDVGMMATTTANNGGGAIVLDDSQCLSMSWMPHLHALPPLPLVAAALGIIFHAPFSFIYHWKYAHRLPAGLPRTNHWSRRMDQAMIHFCSGCMAYATSGRYDFFLANALFNMDCIYRQFKKVVRPRRNQVRIFISVVAYTIPLLRRGDLMLFSKIWFLFSVSGWLFSRYPIGGWSHSVFHIVMALVPPLLMTAALELPASQPQLKFAAQCAVLAKESLGVS